MAITVKHLKVSTVPDAGDDTLVEPSDWNADHTLTGLGTMAEQNANAVAITGGTISGVTIPASNVTGTLGVANGGTGASTLTGYVKGTGTTPMTASATIPNTDITGLGTASTKDAGSPNGVATLDAGGKVPVSELPAAVLGALSYQGTWNASTNTPTLTSSVGTKGYYYVVNVAGNTNLNGITDWLVGDWAVFNGSIWQKVDNTETVTSVNGQTGAVVLTYTDVGAFPATATTGTGNVVLATGATQANPTISNYENFTPTTAPSYSEGRVWYDSTEKALAFYNDSSALAVHVGQDLIVKVINNTGSTIANGSPVYITGTSSGQTYPNVALAKADVAATSAVIGLTNGAIPSGATGYVTSQGIIDNVNTGMFTVGQVLYLSPFSAGQLMNTIPPTGITVQVGVVSFVNTTTGHIYVKQTTPLAVPASIITGTLAVNQGGTGATTLTGYVKGSGTSALTASGTIPTTDLSGTVTNAQLANSAITINGTSTSLGGSISVGTVTSVTGTAPVVSSGGATPAISMPAATGSVNGYLTSTDWTTFNNKSNTSGTVTSVGGTGTVNGISLSGTVTSSGNLTLGGALTGVSLATQVTGTLPIANGGTGATVANGAMANLMGFTSTVTAGGTTTLTNTSSYYQLFTGSTTQTVVLPVTSTLQQGWTFHICNNSTGDLTVQSSGLNTLITIPAGLTAMCTCVATGGTGITDWEAGYTDFSTRTGSGAVVLAASPSISGTLTVTGAINANTNTATLALGTAQTTGICSIGGTTQTGALTVGQSTVSQTTNIQTGETASGSTKTINIGSGGLAGSTTNINLGQAGAPININLNSAANFATTVSFNNITSSITATGLTTGSLNLGGASQTGTNTFGQSTVTGTTNLASGATASGSTKTMNIGTGGLVGSTTAIAIGSTAGTSTTTVNGTLNTPVINATNGIVVNSNTVSASYTIPTGSSAMSTGPMTVASGQTVTVSSGSRWVVL